MLRVLLLAAKRHTYVLRCLTCTPSYKHNIPPSLA